MAEPIRLYLDEDTISRALIRALLARHVDLLTAQEANLMPASDTTQLAFATSQNRTLFTFNTKDFAQLHIHYMETGQPMPVLSFPISFRLGYLPGDF